VLPDLLIGPGLSPRPGGPAVGTLHGSEEHMAWPTRPTRHRLGILLGLILTLGVATPQLASGKHRQPKLRYGTAAFVAGFGSPTGSSDPSTPTPISPERFECYWVEFEPVHDYVCEPSPKDPTYPPTLVPWQASFQLKHALTRSGNPPPRGPRPGWTGLASPEFAPQLSCAWDGTPVDERAPEPRGAQLAKHFVCSYRNPQLHTLTVAQMLSVCEDANLLDPDCAPGVAQPYPPYSLDSGALDPWYFSDAMRPDTSVAAGPTRLVASRSATLAFVSSEDGSSFKCRLDGGAWEECDSPQGYEHLEDGWHSFEVFATDAAGNDDETPARRSFTVDTAGPRVEISGRTVRLTRRGLAQILLRCPTSELSGVCVGKLTLRNAKRVDAGLRGRFVTLGKKGFKVRKGRRGLVKVKLSRQARLLVAQRQSLGARGTARARDRVGNVATTSRRFVLEAPVR
jgi:hypothetical protein